MAQNNLAKEAYPEFISRPEPQTPKKQQPLHSPKPASTPAKLPLSTFEKTLLTVGGLIMVALMICVVSAKISLTNAQRHLQNTSARVTALQTQNNNAQQQINELQSKGRLDKIAHQQGLQLSNANIRNVQK